MGAANIRSGLDALAKVIVGVGAVAAIGFGIYIGAWVYWWVF